VSRRIRATASGGVLATLVVLGTVLLAARAQTADSVPDSPAGGTGTSGGDPVDALASLVPFRTHSGPIDYVAAGAAMRNQGYGTITVTWPGPLVAAYLVWGLMDGIPTSYTRGRLNGVWIDGTVVDSSPLNPCWIGGIHTLAADVTAHVLNGPNSLTEFPSGITTGEDPWVSPETLPMLEGATLVAIYQTGASAQEVTLYVAANTLTGAGASLTDTLPHAAASSTSAKTTFIVSDGQLPGNDARWNSMILDANAFPGGDPKATPTPWSYGNLWDTRTYPVAVPLGSTSDSATISGDGDCLTWHGQVLRVDRAPNNPPALSWTGWPGFVADGVDPEVGNLLTTFSYRVTYADADGDAPAWVALRIEKPAATEWRTFAMAFLAWGGAPDDYVAGAIFGFDASLPLGADFWYCFSARDGQQNASGPPTACTDAPDVVDGPPMAVAWASPAAAFLGELVAFDGSASTDDLGIISYAWDFGDSATGAGVTATHGYASRGTFTATLTVVDTGGQSDSDSVEIDVVNRPPRADAGSDATAAKRALVRLDGTASLDPDGDPLTFLWSQSAGPPIALAGADTATPSFTPIRRGAYAFALAVTDGWGGAASDAVTVVVENRAPIADAGPEGAAQKRTVVTLDGSRSSDPDGDGIAYAWTQTGGPAVVLAGADTDAPTFTPTSVGTYTFHLRVDDGDTGSSEDTVVVTVWGLPPVARLAAAPPTAPVGATVNLDGGDSADPDGMILDYAFDFGDGTSAGGAAGVRSHQYDAPGTYAVTLIVTDDDGNVSTARVLVQIGGSVSLNWKPLVAAIFTGVLLAAGVWSSRRRPWGGHTEGRAVVVAFAVTSLPFVLAEAATGVVSHLTGLLAIPPLVGLGTAVDVGILATGLAVPVYRARKR